MALTLPGDSSIPLPAMHEWLDAALALETPYLESVHRRKVREKSPMTAAVLILFAWSTQQKQWHLLIVRRSEQVKTHQGQMAFPGGMCEPDETGQWEKTALRETDEEVGLKSSQIWGVGALAPLKTVTGFEVYPLLALLKTSLEEVSLRLDADEIAEAVWIPFEQFFQKEVYQCEECHVFQVGRHRIWGFTGTLIRNLVDRFRRVQTPAGMPGFS